MLIMKLYTKIAGTLALPLALAVAANSAQAYTVVDTSEHKLSVGGYVSAIFSVAKTGDKKSAVNDKFNSDFDAVGRLFAEQDIGLAARMENLLEPYLTSGGVLDSRTDGYKKTIERIGEGREALNQRLSRLEERLFRQFNALDGLLAQLNSTSNYLAQQLNNLPGFGNLFERG